MSLVINNPEPAIVITDRSTLMDRWNHRRRTFPGTALRDDSSDDVNPTRVEAEMDLVFDEALQKLSTKRANVSGQLSDQLSDGMMVQLMADLAAEPQSPGMVKNLQTARPAAVTSSNHQEREDFLAQDQG